MCGTKQISCQKFGLHSIPYNALLLYAGKFWRGKILANLPINANSPNFFPANTYKDTETTEDLPLDPPKFFFAICFNGSNSPKFYPSKIFPCMVYDTTVSGFLIRFLAWTKLAQANLLVSHCIFNCSNHA